MDFAVTAGALARAVGLVRGCVPAKSTMPVLSHVLVTASAGEISIRATNLDMEAESRERADVGQDGSLALPGDVLFGIVKRFAKGDLLTLTSDGARTQLKCGRSRYELRTMPADEFPKFEAFDHEGDHHTFVIGAKALMALIESTIYAVSSDETRIYLNGVFLYTAEDKLVAATADGHRFAERVCALPDGAEGMPHVIVPTLAARQIAGLMAETEGDVTVQISAARLAVSTSNAQFSTRLIASKFPDYRAIIPPMTAPAATVKPKVLSDAIDRAAMVYAGADVKAPAARMATGANGIDLMTGVPGMDEAVEDVEAEVHERGADIRVNARYLAEMLKQWPDVDLDMQASQTPGGPVLFMAKEMPDMRHVIMPQLR